MAANTTTPRRIATVAALLCLGFSAPAGGVEPTLDASFGTGGWARTNIGTGQADTPHDLLVQPDGRILTAGISTISFDYFLALTRHLPDGTLDTTFDGDGIVGVHWALRDQANAIALQSTGKIVAVGMQAVSNAGSAQIPSIYRFHADGAIDSTFETNGAYAARFEPISSGEFSDVMVLPDDRIIAAGRCNANANGGNPGYAFRRRLADGGPDPSYGSGGQVLYHLTPEPGLLFLRPAVGFAPDGAAIIASTFYDFGDGRVEFSVLRVDADGDVVPFGAASLLLPNIEVFNQPLAMERLDDGSFLLGATTPRPGNPGAGNFTVFHFLTDGSLDNDFGTNGRTDVQLDASSDVLIDMTLAGDGRILLVGNLGNLDGGIVRLTADGDPDPTFGANGVAIVDVSIFGGSAWFTAATFDDDQRLLAAGYDFTINSGDFALARYAAVPTGVGDTPKAAPGFVLHTAYPNPTHGRATLAFELAQDARASIEVFDVAGRRVAVLLDGPRGAGRHEAVWSGRLADGRTAPSGVYFARFIARDASGRVLHRSTGRILQLR